MYDSESSSSFSGKLWHASAHGQTDLWAHVTAKERAVTVEITLQTHTDTTVFPRSPLTAESRVTRVTQCGGGKRKPV